MDLVCRSLILNTSHPVKANMHNFGEFMLALMQINEAVDELSLSFTYSSNLMMMLVSLFTIM
ncbi:unnamed protein product [Arabis nemorensis]|uniref:Uncharacterized protein n=1 Tax=Arabis nemorensis TaxID=586526 RepID=A0A565BRK6_9BRAS|nr:unnamed protein product [Arabis nemorensis]